MTSNNYYYTKSGKIVDELYKLRHDYEACILDPIEGIYNGTGPDILYIKNWKDKDHKDYMKLEKDDIISTIPTDLDYRTVHAEGKKNDIGKPMFSCLPPDALMELGKVAELGARKYGLHNYRKGIKVSRILDAAFRHLIAAVGNEDHDPVDGNNHLASAAWNMLSALQMIKDHPELDDRYKKET